MAMSGAELKKECLKLGITTAELSRASGVSDTTLTKIFNGKHVRDATRFKAINAFNRLKAQLESGVSGSKIAP
jgi:transcriptional regulator with XRE-family HTH domain